MPRQAFERKVAALESLRSTPDRPQTRDELRTALADRNNFLVARAAAIVADLQYDDLIPELLTAYTRFFTDPAKSDPQCLAKQALARALRDLSHHGEDAYLRGLTHVQLEPAWGGRADTAASLRGTCALALSQCPLDDLEILNHLADTLADPDRGVRVDGARAIEQLNRPEGAILLRLKLLLGDADSVVMGQCFESMLSLAPDGGLGFVARFLQSPNPDVQFEAASVLAQCRDPRALAILHEFWQDPLRSLDVRQAILINLGASALPEAVDFLLDVMAREPVPLATLALEALSNSRLRTDARPRLATIVSARDSAALTTAFNERFPD
jgi:HEAT repeat protein